MSETPEVLATTLPEGDTAQGVVDPYTFLAEFKGAPTKAQIEQWKTSTCNGRVKLFTPDPSGKRVFILRGLSARELEAVQNDIPANTAQERLEGEMQRATAAKATLWTSLTPTGKIVGDDLRNTGAGLTSSLYELVFQLSDFLTPVMLDKLSTDL
jgi:hypothetical protein